MWRARAAPNTPDMSDVTVIGAGMIGLACARALARGGARVTLIDAGEAIRPASRAAAGMCAPETEALLHPPSDPAEAELWRAGLVAWEAFELEAGAQSGLDPAVRGTDLHLQDGVRHVPSERVIDPVRAMARLRADALAAGVRVRAEAGRPEGVVVIAAGAGSSTFSALAPEAARVTPVRGQLIEVARPAGFPDRMVRSPDVYLAPRRDRLVIGATSEPGVTRLAASSGDAGDLLARASALWPGLDRAAVLASRVGLRPATPVGPLIGPSRMPGVFLATGAYRNGVLIALVAAETLAATVQGRPHPLSSLVDPRRTAGKSVP